MGVLLNIEEELQPLAFGRNWKTRIKRPGEYTPGRRSVKHNCPIEAFFVVTNRGVEKLKRTPDHSRQREETRTHENLKTR